MNVHELLSLCTNTCAGEFSSTRDVFDSNLEKVLSRYHDWKQALRVTPGWFNETLPASLVRNIAFLRLDGDLYVSTMDALNALYDRVSPGG